MIKEELEKISNEKITINEQIDKLIKENKNLIDNNNELNENIFKKEFEIKNKNNEIQLLESNINELKNEKNNNTEIIKVLNQQIKDVSEKTKNFEEIKKSNEDKIKTLNEQIDNYKNEITTLNNYINLAKKTEEENIKLKEPINKIFNDENIIIDERDSNIDIINLSVEEKILKSINFSEREKEKEDLNINKLKAEIKNKDNIIKKMKEEIANLSKTQIIEHRTIIDDEEFNELVDENEELKKMNKELLEKLNELNNSTRTKTDINKEENLNENENIINIEKQNQIIKEQKEELDSLRIRFEQLYKELNQYRKKNSDLIIEIKRIREQSFNDSRKSLSSLNDDFNVSKMRKSYNSEIEKLTYKLNDIEGENSKLKELLKQNGNDLKNKNIDINENKND